MFKRGDTVEFQHTEGTRTSRRVVKVVQGGEHGGVGVDIFKKGMLLPFNENEVTTVVRRA